MVEVKKDDCARSALRVVQREIDDLYMDKSQSYDLINNLQQQIQALREDTEYWKNGYASATLRWQQSNKISNQSNKHDVQFVRCCINCYRLCGMCWVMKMKTIGILMMIPIITVLAGSLALMIGWKVVPLIIGALAFTWWFSKAIEYISSRDYCHAVAKIAVAIQSRHISKSFAMRPKFGK